MFYKHKRGNITVVLFLCIFVALVSTYMIYNTLQLKIELKVLKDGYQVEMTDASINHICADKILQILDGRTLEPDEQILTSTDLQTTKQRINDLAGKDLDISINSPTADSLTELHCEVNNMKLVITGITKTYNRDADENIVSITLDTDNANVTISRA